MKKFFYLLYVVLFMQLLSAQNVQKCHTDEYMQHLIHQNPELKEAIDATFEAAKIDAAQHPHHKSLGNWDTIFRIPVVFHVVYNNAAENISTALIQSQIDVLNEDFRRFNADTSNTRPLFKPRAGDVGFEFYLATLDPDGNPTNGINRVSTNQSSFSFFNIDGIKSSATGGADGWDPNEYLNIWIGDFGGIILGFAYPPTAAPNWPAGTVPTDESVWGIALHYEIVGRNNPLAVGALSIANKGRTLVHEMGHFWGLRHIWGDAGSIFVPLDCDVTKDDGISDTPHAGSNSQAEGCDFSKNSCVFETPDEPDMVENYMDYSTDGCTNMFTDGQVQIMRSMAVIGRPGLAFILSDDEFLIEIGDYIIINGTDTIIVDATTNFTINAGDIVLFVHENNGYNYTATAATVIAANETIYVTSDGEIINPSAISRLDRAGFNIFPNPTKDVLHINGGANKLPYTVQLHNLHGQLLKKQIFEGNINLTLSNFESGMYMVTILNENEIIGTQKISLIK